MDETNTTATNDAIEAARRQLALDKEAREKTAAEYAERMKGKPTPTQEENDLAALGAHVHEKEHDGSPHERDLRPHARMHNPEEAQARLDREKADANKRQQDAAERAKAAAEAEKPSADYQTRQSRAAAPTGRRTE